MGNPTKGKHMLLILMAIYIIYEVLLVIANLPTNTAMPVIIRIIFASILFFYLYKGNGIADFIARGLFSISSFVSVVAASYIIKTSTYSIYGIITLFFTVYCIYFTWFLVGSKDYTAFRGQFIRKKEKAVFANNESSADILESVESNENIEGIEENKEVLDIEDENDMEEISEMENNEIVEK